MNKPFEECFRFSARLILARAAQRWCQSMGLPESPLNITTALLQLDGHSEELNNPFRKGTLLYACLVLANNKDASAVSLYIAGMKEKHKNQLFLEIEQLRDSLKYLKEEAGHLLSEESNCMLETTLLEASKALTALRSFDE